MIRKERMLDEFGELAAIDSHSLGERAIADRLYEKLRELGMEVREDRAGEDIGGSAGNLYAFLPGKLPGKPLLFCAHMDTVEPASGKRAGTDKDGRISGSGTSVLGADDLCGITEILEAIRHLREEHLPHRPVEILFTVAEEIYGKGVKAFDHTWLKAEEVYVLDMSGPVGTAAVQAPALISFTAEIYGRAAHAGFAPEAGVHAIGACARAITSIPLGRLDNETTRNIGMISGGEATNIVPGLCTVKGEVRSFDEEKAVRAAGEVRAAFEKQPDVKVVWTQKKHLNAYHTPECHPVVQRFLRACGKLGLPGRTTATLGGSDNNDLNVRGLTGIVLSCGMEKVHSTEEYTTAVELCRGAALVAALLQDTGPERQTERTDNSCPYQ